MQVQTQEIQRLFFTMAIVLFAGLLGMASVEMLFVQPLSQSIDRGMTIE